MSMENRGDEQQHYSTAGEPYGSSTTPPYSSATGSSSTGAGTPGDPAAGYAGPYAAGPLPGAPNPALAGLLGFIPGVGAMYNGQFGKGIAHIAIFAVFCSLSNHVNGIFGLFIAGWVLYMAFEAYQTALARRDGLPLPDPFGLNNIGERLGFRGNPDFSSFRAQGARNPVGSPEPTRPGYPAGNYGGSQAPFQVDPSGTAYRPGTAPMEPPPMPGAAYVPPAAYPYAGSPPPAGYGAPGYTAPPSYGAAPYGVPPMPPVRGSGLPSGALWLIGLGLFALLGSIRAFDFLQGEVTGGIFLIGMSLFLFWRRWNSASALYPAGAATVRWSVLQGARGSVVLFVVGLLTLLQGLRVVYWENSWPFLLIALGVVLLGERLAFNRMNAEGSAAGYAAQPGSDDPAVATSSTSILPRYPRANNDTSTREGQ